MIVREKPKVYCNNGCICSGTEEGSIVESVTSKELEDNIQQIIFKYKTRRYAYGYSDFIHIKDFGDFHYCMSCIGRIYTNFTNKK